MSSSHWHSSPCIRLRLSFVSWADSLPRRTLFGSHLHFRSPALKPPVIYFRLTWHNLQPEIPLRHPLASLRWRYHFLIRSATPRSAKPCSSVPAPQRQTSTSTPPSLACRSSTLTTRAGRRPQLQGHF